MKKNKFWNFVQTNEETAELLLYGDISNETWYGDEVTPIAFAEDLQACEGKPLTVHINSGGGDVFAAAAIYNLLKQYTGETTVYIDGLCASAATVVACAGDTVIMPSNAIYMIHDPSVCVFGAYNATELDKLSEALIAIKESIKAVYQGRCGEDKIDEIEQLMTDETYLLPEKALELGLIDTIDGIKPIETVINNGVMFVNKVQFNVQNIEKAQKFIKGKGENMKNSNNLVDSIKSILGIDTKDDTVNAVNQAELAERERITTLDKMKTGNEIIDSIIESAKVNGKSVDEAKMFVDAVAEPVAKQEEDKKAVEMIRNLITDQMESGAKDVDPQKDGDSTENDTDEKKKRKQLIELLIMQMEVLNNECIQK